MTDDGKRIEYIAEQAAKTCDVESYTGEIMWTLIEIARQLARIADKYEWGAVVEDIERRAKLASKQSRGKLKHK